MIQPARWGNLCLLQEAPWSYPHDKTCLSQLKDMDTDNTQAARCPALRLYVVHVVLSFFISLLNSLSCRSRIIFFFFVPSPLHLPSTDYLSRVLGSKLIRHSGTKQERTGSSLLDPTRSVFFFFFFFELCCSELKRHLCSKKEMKIYVSCQRKKMSREKSRVLCTGRGVCLSL